MTRNASRSEARSAWLSESGSRWLWGLLATTHLLGMQAYPESRQQSVRAGESVRVPPREALLGQQLRDPLLRAGRRDAGCDRAHAHQVGERQQPTRLELEGVAVLAVAGEHEAPEEPERNVVAGGLPRQGRDDTLLPRPLPHSAIASRIRVTRWGSPWTVRRSKKMLTRSTAVGSGRLAQSRKCCSHPDSGWRQSSVVAMTLPGQ